MEGILRALSINDDESQNAALQALQEVPTIAYQYIDDYIVKIGNETHKLLQSSDFEQTRYIFNFWTTLCKEEQLALKENMSKNYIPQYLASLLPLIF